MSQPHGCPLPRGRARFTDGLAERTAQIDAGIEDPYVEMPWGSFSFINRFNGWKNGKTPDSPVADDGTRGLAWRDQLASQDVFGCAANDFGVAVRNWKDSRSGWAPAPTTQKGDGSPLAAAV